jgi:hypothetical protein
MKLISATIATAVIISLFTSSSAHSARFNALNTIYFDANNNIIGQQIAFCENVDLHGGNIDASNPYHITIMTGCGDPKSLCQPDFDNGWVCKPMGNNIGVKINYYQSATNLPVKTFCSAVYACDVGIDIAYGWGFELKAGYQ